MTKMRDCPHCKAHYRVGNWYAGYSEGTTGNFIATAKIDQNKCPICRKKCNAG